VSQLIGVVVLHYKNLERAKTYVSARSQLKTAIELILAHLVSKCLNKIVLERWGITFLISMYLDE
jgi:hypothetical protein